MRPTRRRRGGDPTIVVDGAIGEHLEVLSAGGQPSLVELWNGITAGK